MESDLSIFPNPVKDKLTLDFKKNIAPAEIKIINIFGETRIQTYHNSGNKKSIDLSALNSGFYYAVILIEGERILFSFVKK